MSNQCPICNSNLPEDARACPVCGFHIMGKTESFSPVKMDGAQMGDVAPTPATISNQQYELRVVRGPQTGTDIILHEGSLTIGRDPRCDIFLNDMTVSRTHAKLEIKDDRCVLRDNNSFNGVWVNDRSIESCLLKSGDLIQIGSFCLMFRQHAQL